MYIFATALIPVATLIATLWSRSNARDSGLFIPLWADIGVGVLFGGLPALAGMWSII